MERHAIDQSFPSRGPTSHSSLVSHPTQKEERTRVTSARPEADPVGLSRWKRPAEPAIHRDPSRSSTMRCTPEQACSGGQDRVVSQTPPEGDGNTVTMSALRTCRLVTSSVDSKRRPSNRNTPVAVVSQRNPFGALLYREGQSPCLVASTSALSYLFWSSSWQF
jgi:hypothetical protein